MHGGKTQMQTTEQTDFKIKQEIHETTIRTIINRSEGNSDCDLKSRGKKGVLEEVIEAICSVFE